MTRDDVLSTSSQSTEPMTASKERSARSAVEQTVSPSDLETIVAPARGGVRAVSGASVPNDPVGKKEESIRPQQGSQAKGGGELSAFRNDLQANILVNGQPKSEVGGAPSTATGRSQERFEEPVVRTSPVGSPTGGATASTQHERSPIRSGSALLRSDDAAGLRGLARASGGGGRDLQDLSLPVRGERPIESSTDGRREPISADRPAVVETPSSRASIAATTRVVQQGADLAAEQALRSQVKQEPKVPGSERKLLERITSPTSTENGKTEPDPKPFRADTSRGEAGSPATLSSKGSGTFAESFRQGESAFGARNQGLKRTEGRSFNVDGEKSVSAQPIETAGSARAAAIPRPSPSAPASSIVEQVAQRLALIDRPQTVRVALDPAHLGPVVIRFSRRGSQMRVKITAQNLEASSALMRDLPRLQESLVRHGEDLKVEVSIDSSRGNAQERSCFDGPESRQSGESGSESGQGFVSGSVDESLLPGSVGSAAIEGNRILDVTT